MLACTSTAAWAGVEAVAQASIPAIAATLAPALTIRSRRGRRSSRRAGRTSPVLGRVRHHGRAETAVDVVGAELFAAYRIENRTCGTLVVRSLIVTRYG